MMSRGGAVVVLMAAVMGSAWDLAARGERPAAAAQDSKELYQNVYHGWKWWHVYCYRCHGTNAVGGTLAPNLTDPNEKLTLKDRARVLQMAHERGIVGRDQVPEGGDAVGRRPALLIDVFLDRDRHAVNHSADATCRQILIRPPRQAPRRCRRT